MLHIIVHRTESNIHIMLCFTFSWTDRLARCGVFACHGLHPKGGTVWLVNISTRELKAPPETSQHSHGVGFILYLTREIDITKQFVRVFFQSGMTSNSNMIFVSLRWNIYKSSGILREYAGFERVELAVPTSSPIVTSKAHAKSLIVLDKQELNKVGA